MDSVAEGVPRGKQGLSLLEEMKGNKGQADQNTQCHPLTALSLPLASLHLSDLPLLITKDEKKISLFWWVLSVGLVTIIDRSVPWSWNLGVMRKHSTWVPSFHSSAVHDVFLCLEQVLLCSF